MSGHGADRLGDIQDAIGIIRGRLTRGGLDDGLAAAMQRLAARTTD